MAPRCRSTWEPAPIVCFILAAVFLSTTFAKPFQSKKFTLSQSDVQYYTNSPDYEYVKPVRLGTRHQRSVEDYSVKSTSEYSVEGFDQVFHIQLSESMDLFNAGLLVKRIDANGQVRIDQPNTGCFHQGSLMDSEETTSVSLSTCNGLVGIIRTPEADFALKPLKENHILKMQSSEDEVPTHIMYKLSPADMAISQVNTENERRRASDAERQATSGTKYVETSVVADSTMFDYHGDDTEFYLFTILNQVAGLFRDKSLSADLRLLITSITILEAPQRNLDLTDELSHSLKNFCEWQKDGKSDISVLLTRRDLEIGGNDAVTGKAKDLGGACDPSRRCIIAEDHGPSGTIFTLAHEIGHSLGMYHDDAESGCANNRNIMATDNSGGSEAFKWSRCSDQDLLQFLSTSDSSCLDKTEDDFPAYNSETVMMPGHFYDALKQCQMTFGPEATVADDYIYSKDMCLELQCMLPGSSEPVTNHIPALDGTKCGEGRGMICVHGQCLKVVSMYDCEGGDCVPEWLPGSFGDCQPDCYTYRNVFCVERRDDSTTVLVTDLSRCPIERPAEREYCCETQPVVGETSYQVLNSACSVTCGTGTETREIACVDSEGTIVNDTFCTDARPPEEVECAPAACPGVTYVLFYSSYGECSVTCDGGVQTRTAFCAKSDGTSESVEICRLVFPEVVTERACNLEACSGTVVDTFFYQTAPVGTCSVTCGEGIQQLSVTCQNLAGDIVDDANCASLQRPAPAEICIEEDCTDTYRYVATVFGACSVTCGNGTRSRSIFCLNEANRVVDDTFCADLTRPDSEESCTLSPCSITYTYEAMPFPECTLPCGTQMFTRTVTCVSSEGNVVSNQNCINAGLIEPPSTLDCGLDPCGNYVYQVGEYGECSATCGIGIQQRSVACIDLDNNNQTVSNNLCSGDAPTSAILCNLGECPTEYSYLTSTFSECSCAGIQTRFVVCITFVNGAPVRATDQDCVEAGLEQPNDTRACEAPSTCNPVWRFGEWSDCSVTCGNGVQTRVVFCVESEESTVIVPSSSCDPALEPPSVQICNLGDCVTYTWVSESFGDCSVTCGEGVRVRNVLCYAISGGTFELVDGSLCNPALEPPSEEICELEDCGGVYEATPWSECSVTCAVGVQTREVSCVTRKGSGIVIPDSECFNMTRPSETRECYLEPCPLPYGCDQSYVTEDSITYTLQSPGYPLGYPADLDCSKVLVAPEGSFIRITFTDLQLEEGCAYDAVRLIDLETNSINNLCDEVELPYEYESTGPMLEVLFVTDATVSRRGFTATYQAVQATVVEYMTGEWGECSVTCGEGVEQRDVICLQDGVEVDSVACVDLPVPPSTRPCQEEDCPAPGACRENILRLAPGTITSPEYPSVYPENVTCVNTLRAPLGNVIFIDFNFIFFLNQDVSCSEGDSLLIQDTSATDGRLICQNTGRGIELTSLTNEVSLIFVSDSAPAATGTGFSLAYDFVSPDVDICGGEIITSGQPIYSPNYPENYDDNVTCVTNITNSEGCISIEFLSMDIDNGNRVNGICRDDAVTLKDFNNPSLSQTYCRQSVPESRWLSASGNVQVSFTSNLLNSSQGYIAIPRFVECPQAFWVPLPFGNCSASCGLGNRTRELECRNALTNELTDPDNCPEEEPPRTELCFLGECPSCDVRIAEGNRVIEFPMMEDYYLYNDECTLTITNENGCMNLFFISLDIDEGMGDDCDDDYLMIFDPENMFANEPYCGNSPGSLTYQTLGSTVELTLRTEDASRFKSFEVFPSYVPCVTYAYVPGPWSECSASCEGGVRTRVVPCMNLLTNTPASDEQCEDSATYDTEEECNTEECPECSQSIMAPGVLVSPGFETEDGYENNLDCMYSITNPNSDKCVTISFVSFDLGEPSENCSDYVQINDTEGGVSALYCGLPENATAPVFYSRSSHVDVVFSTDDSERNNGFEAIVSFGSCPEFGFFTGNFSECSVTCGEGVQYRTVECRRFSNGQLAVDEICRDQRPPDSRPCSLPECPSCDRVLTEEGIFTSPNGPMNYEDDQECVYTLVSGEDECIRVSFIGTFELGEAGGECEEGDYIQLSDENWEYLDQTYCGDMRPPVWRSRTNVSTLTFYSDEEDTYRGFTAYLAFVDCPRYGFTVGEYGECDVSCGVGVQMREVECTDLTTQESVSIRLCTDPMPPSVVECNNGPCPSCGETFTTNSVSIVRDDFMENEECLYNVTSLEGQCIRTYLLSWDLSPPPNEDLECEGDSLKFVDAAYPYRAAEVCGRGQALIQFITYGSTGLAYFTSDDEDQGGSFRIFTQFEECPEYGYTATNFSECSVTCGTGIRTREVFCTRLATGENVGLGNCTIEVPLPTTEECNTQPCFDCNMSFNRSATIVSPDYPRDYPDNLKCVYEFENIVDNMCWSVVANDFDVEYDENGTCVDGFYVEDVGFEDREPFLGCGDELAPIPLLSFSETFRITFYSDDENREGGRFNVSVNSVVCPDYGYLAGPYSECTATCGLGFKYRNVTCQNLRTREVVNDSFCNDLKPTEVLPCDLEPCPSCDQLIFEDAQYIYSPSYPDDYENEQTCTTTVIAPEGMCINLFIISLELEEPDPYAGCFGSDYLLFIDSISPVPPFFDVDQVYCGNQENILWFSSQNVAFLSFTSNEEGAYPGYEIYSTFVDCQRYFYGVLPFGECSVTCGLGERRREIGCVDRLNNYTTVDDSFCSGDIRPIETVPCYDFECPEECYLYINETQFVTSPDYPDNYPLDLDCVVELENPNEAGCWQIDFLDFDLEEPDRFCYDEFRIINLDFEVDETVICGDDLPPPYISISDSIQVQFTSDSSFTGRGFNVSVTTVECLSDYAYIPGPWSECSVTCGMGGIQTRELNCTLLANGTIVDESFCNGTEPPPTMRRCGRLPPCPPCLNFFNESGVITSPNFPSPYNTDEVCYTLIQPPSDQCVGLFISSLQLSEPEEDDCFGGDYLTISDVMPPYAPSSSLDQVFCGTQQNIVWLSALNGSLVTLTFTSDEEETYPGYQIFLTFQPCDRYYYSPLSFGECSVTCGTGVRRRELACIDSFTNTNVSDHLCADDLRPVETLACRLPECPSCDSYISEDNQETGTGMGYDNDQECEYEFENPEGGCIRLEITMNLPPANPDGECNRDYLVYREEGDYEREIVLCGETVFNITSRYNSTELTFVSDEVADIYSGFSVTNSFVECPAYGFIADEEFGECDVECGSGIQMRNVSCIDLSNGTVVDDSLCEDDRPEEIRSCNDEPCPTCSRYINTTNSFVAVESYEPDQDCLYTVDFGDSCVAVSFLTFELQDPEDDECVDFLEIRDLAPFTDQLERTFCGDGPRFGYRWLSRSGQVQIRFVSDDSDEGEGFNLLLQAVPCPEQGFIYGNYSECSVTCGEGVQTRDVTCVELDNGVPGTAVADSQCEDPRPMSSVECDLAPCPSCDRNFTLRSPANSLVVGSDMPYLPEKSCTNTLITDEGMCIRVAFASIDIEESDDCVNDSLVIVDPNNEAINFTLCKRGGITLPIFSTSNMLKLTLSSNEAVEGNGYNSIASRIDCPNVTWAAENIGSCSVTCGTGVQMRNVYCMNQVNGRIFVQEESCPGERPPESVPCVLDDCPEECESVYVGETQTELTSPGFPETPYENNLTCPNTYVTFSSCLAIVVVEIDLGPPENCINDYFEIFDSSVDVDQTRLRLCGNELPENNLWVGSTSPFYTQLVTNEEGRYKGYNLSLSYVPCPMQGFTVGEFSECSMLCGSGVRTRNVTCENSTGDILPDTACWGQRPLSEEPCGMNCTYNVDVSTWSSCSITCGFGGVQTRTVRCLAQNMTEVNTTVCENEGLMIPETERQCNLTACPIYSYLPSNYSECSVTCGSGVQTRTLKCVDQNMTEVNTTVCENEGLMLPETQRQCNLTACPTYSYVPSNYSECSMTCGDGVQVRNVTCQDNLGNIVSDLLCANLTMLNTTQACSAGECPVDGCNYTISGTSVTSGNLTSPNYPKASPSGLTCPITFIIPSGYLLNIRFTEFNLDASCSENITLNGDVAGETFFCSDSIILPASATYSSDSRVSFLYLTDDDDSNSPYYFAEWQFVSLTG